MPFTTPTTRSTGDLITAAQWNTDLVENIKILGNPPRARAVHSTTQSLTSGSWTAISLDTENWDTDGMHSTVTNPARFTAATAGKYQVCGSIRFATNGTGLRAIGVRVNGTGAGAPTVTGVVVAPLSSDVTVLNMTTEVQLAVGDWVELCGLQTSGGALNSVNSSGEGNPFCAVRWTGT